MRSSLLGYCKSLIGLIVISVTVILFLWGITYLWSLLAPHLNTLEKVKTLISFISTLATAIAGLLVLWNVQIARRNAKQGEEKLITERFAKAVEQLGRDKIEVRSGGIYSLERIAKDSLKDHWTIMEILTAFIREKCPLVPEIPEESPKIATDIQAALTVIGRRIVEQDPKYKILNLNFTNLSRADLSAADLNGANFSKADLSKADLSKANLSAADLSKANFSDAIFRRCGNLILRQVQSAKNWEQAFHDPSFRQQLDLPPE